LGEALQALGKVWDEIGSYKPKEYITWILEQTGGNKTKAAEVI
jgi:hypothetical protein